MAVVNTLSTVVTNADSDPIKLSPLRLSGARLRAAVATVPVAAGDDDTSVYRCLRVHSSWRVAQLLLLNDAITGGTSYDFGVYDIAANGGEVVDVDAFASAVDLSSARVAPLDIATEAADIANSEKAIWELLGLTADPNKEYDIAATANTVGTAAGDITLKMTYVAND